MNTTPTPTPGAAPETLRGLELVSALADGQLSGLSADSGCEIDGAMRLALDDSAGRTAWDRYHLIGDVLRSADLVAPAHASAGGPAFVAAVMQRIAAEPPLHAQLAPAQTTVQQVRAAGSAAANDAWGWKLLAGCASVAAVAAIAWSLTSAPQQGAVQAAVPATAVPATSVAVANPEPVMIRDPRLDELLAAHRQFGGTSALHVPAGFLRNATFETPNR